MKVLAALFVLTAASSAVAVEAPPAPAAPKNFQVPAKAERALANGLEMTFIEFGTIPKTAITAILRVGNLTEGDKTWLADLTGELIKEGAGTRSANEIAEAAADMGGSVNLAVGPDQTTISMDVLSEHGSEAVALIADLLRRAQLPESELPRIKRDFQRQLWKHDTVRAADEHRQRSVRCHALSESSVREDLSERRAAGGVHDGRCARVLSRQLRGHAHSYLCGGAIRPGRDRTGSRQCLQRLASGTGSADQYADGRKQATDPPHRPTGCAAIDHPSGSAGD